MGILITSFLIKKAFIYRIIICSFEHCQEGILNNMLLNSRNKPVSDPGNENREPFLYSGGDVYSIGNKI